MTKYKVKKIYDLADPYIQTMVRFDIVGVLSAHSKRFSEIYHKSLPVILQQNMDADWMPDLIECCENRIRQSKFYQADFMFQNYFMNYNEDFVQKCFKEFIEKLKALPL